MTMAEQLSRFDARSREQWFATGNRLLPPAVSVLLALGIAYELAQLALALLPGEPYGGPPPEVARTVRTVADPQASNLAQLRDWHPFGQAPTESATAAPPPSAIVDAPDTTLNLKLSGTITRSADDESEAMIQSGNQEEKRYFVGDTIEGGNGAVLHSVYPDRVILNRAGRLETLRRPEELPARRAATPTARFAPPQTDADDQGSLRQVISANASRLTDIIRLAPHVESGTVVGFRVNPGRDEGAFNGLGLRAGDIVTDINGIALNDPGRGLQAFEALGEATMGNVTVIRDGAAQVLVIDTSQLESISENRQ